MQVVIITMFTSDTAAVPEPPLEAVVFSVLAVRLCDVESLMEELLKQTSGQPTALFPLWML